MRGIRSSCAFPSRGADAIEQTTNDSTSWFFIILDVHRAIYCAMIAALKGTAGIGAFSAKLRAEWLDYFEASRSDPTLKPPKGDYVLRLCDLLERVERGTADMMGPPLQLTPEQRADILKLNEFRGDLEHVKPQSWSLETSGLPRISANAAEAFSVLLQSFQHHLEVEEIEELERAISKLRALKSEYPSSPPSSWLG